MKATWTTQRIDYLRQHWGRISAQEIAINLGHGITRHSVIGKAHRLGLAHTGPNKFRSKQKEPPMNVMVPTEIPDDAKPLQFINSGQCRYAYGNGITQPYAFCGHKANGSWCKEHLDIVLAQKQKPVSIKVAEEKDKKDEMEELEGLQ